MLKAEDQGKKKKKKKRRKDVNTRQNSVREIGKGLQVYRKL
jgi:hypothetical protein